MVDQVPAGGRATVGAQGRATRVPPPRTAAHFAEFCHFQLSKGQPFAIGALIAIFKNRGNELAGADPEAKQATAIAALKADPRLAYDEELDAWTIKKDAGA